MEPNADGPALAAADARTHRDRQVPAHRAPPDIERALPLLHLESLVEARDLGADARDYQILGRHDVAERVHHHVRVHVVFVFVVVRRHHRIALLPVGTRVEPLLRRAQIAIFGLLKHLAQELANIGLHREVGFQRLVMQLAIIDIDERLRGLGSEARKVESRLLDVEAGGQSDEPIAILQREVRAALSARTEHAELQRMRLVHQVFGGQRQHHRQSCAVE